MKYKEITKFPHCDPRILHAPGTCKVCDLYPEWQELREAWQIAYTGQTPQELPAEKPWMVQGVVLPCPADYIRGDTHKKWGGNIAYTDPEKK